MCGKQERTFRSSVVRAEQMGFEGLINCEVTMLCGSLFQTTSHFAAVLSLKRSIFLTAIALSLKHSELPVSAGRSKSEKVRTVS